MQQVSDHDKDDDKPENSNDEKTQKAKSISRLSKLRSAGMRVKMANQVQQAMKKVKPSEVDSFTDDSGNEIFMMTFEPKPKKVSSARPKIEQRWTPHSQQTAAKSGFSGPQSVKTNQISRTLDLNNSQIPKKATSMQGYFVVLSEYTEEELFDDDCQLRAAEEKAWDELRRARAEREHAQWLAQPEPIVSIYSMLNCDIELEAQVAASCLPVWDSAKQSGLRVRPLPGELSRLPHERTGFDPFVEWYSSISDVSDGGGLSSAEDSPRRRFLEVEAAAAAKDAAVLAAAEIASTRKVQSLVVQPGDCSSTLRPQRNRWRQFRKWYFQSDPPLVRREFLRGEIGRLSRAWRTAWASWRRWLDADFKEFDSDEPQHPRNDIGVHGHAKSYAFVDEQKLEVSKNSAASIIAPAKLEIRSFEVDPPQVRAEYDFSRTWGSQAKWENLSFVMQHLETKAASCDRIVRGHACALELNIPQPPDHRMGVSKHLCRRRWRAFMMWFGGSPRVREGFLVRELKTAAQDREVLSIAKCDSEFLNGARQLNIPVPRQRSVDEAVGGNDAEKSDSQDWTGFESWVAAGPAVDYVRHHVNVVVPSEAKTSSGSREDHFGHHASHEDETLGATQALASKLTLCVDVQTHRHVSAVIAGALCDAAKNTMHLGEELGIAGGERAAEDATLSVVSDVMRWQQVHGVVLDAKNQTNENARDSVEAVQSLEVEIRERRSSRIAQRRRSTRAAAARRQSFQRAAANAEIRAIESTEALDTLKRAEVLRDRSCALFQIKETELLAAADAEYNEAIKKATLAASNALRQAESNYNTTAERENKAPGLGLGNLSASKQHEHGSGSGEEGKLGENPSDEKMGVETTSQSFSKAEATAADGVCRGVVAEAQKERDEAEKLFNKTKSEAERVAGEMRQKRRTECASLRKTFFASASKAIELLSTFASVSQEKFLESQQAEGSTQFENKQSTRTSEHPVEINLVTPNLHVLHEEWDTSDARAKRAQASAKAVEMLSAIALPFSNAEHTSTSPRNLSAELCKIDEQVKLASDTLCPEDSSVHVGNLESMFSGGALTFEPVAELCDDSEDDSDDSRIDDAADLILTHLNHSPQRNNSTPRTANDVDSEEHVNSPDSQFNFRSWYTANGNARQTFLRRRTDRFRTFVVGMKQRGEIVHAACLFDDPESLQLPSVDANARRQIRLREFVSWYSLSQLNEDDFSLRAAEVVGVDILVRTLAAIMKREMKAMRSLLNEELFDETPRELCDAEQQPEHQSRAGMFYSPVRRKHIEILETRKWEKGSGLFNNDEENDFEQLKFEHEREAHEKERARFMRERKMMEIEDRMMRQLLTKERRARLKGSKERELNKLVYEMRKMEAERRKRLVSAEFDSIQHRETGYAESKCEHTGSDAGVSKAKTNQDASGRMGSKQSTDSTRLSDSRLEKEVDSCRGANERLHMAAEDALSRNFGICQQHTNNVDGSQHKKDNATAFSTFTPYFKDDDTPYFFHPKLSLPCQSGTLDVHARSLMILASASRHCTPTKKLPPCTPLRSRSKQSIQNRRLNDRNSRKKTRPAMPYSASGSTIPRSRDSNGLSSVQGGDSRSETVWKDRTSMKAHCGKESKMYHESSRQKKNNELTQQNYRGKGRQSNRAKSSIFQIPSPILFQQPRDRFLPMA